MIHTITIQKQIYFEQAVRQIANCMDKSPSEISDFFNFHNAIRSNKKSISLSCVPKLPGYEYLSIVHVAVPWRTHYKSRFYIYLRIEPLTVINRIQHIKLFECTADNIEKLCNTFRSDMEAFFYTTTEHNTMRLLEDIFDFRTWSANRIDYTIDVSLKNHDEVLLFMNLAKMSTLANSVIKAEYTSIYGNHFYDDTAKCGNNTWELQIYDKEAQIRSKQESYCSSVFNRLLNEAKNIARIEYRKKPSGTKTSSTKLTSRNIMLFLDENIANSWLLSCYSNIIGFEDFYRAYHAEKKLREAFPLNKSEEKRENKREAEAKKRGKRYKRSKDSKKFLQYRQHLINIMNHKGMQNAYNAIVNPLSQRGEAAALRKFKRWNKTIREKAHISPVLIPDNWKNRKHLDIPDDYFPNPIKGPTQKHIS